MTHKSGSSHHDEGSVYLPSQKEIQQRAEILLWMQDMGWEEEVRDAIMYLDNPTPDDVRRLVYQHGPDRALEILRVFLDD